MNKISIKLPGDNDFFTQEAYKVLRTNLQFCGQDIQVIAITSCNENEGKTTVALHLARSLAELGKEVLLIDTDMRKSVLAGRNSNAKDVVGLSELLTGMVALGEALYQTQYPTLQLIFAERDSKIIPCKTVVINVASAGPISFICTNKTMSRMIFSANVPADTSMICSVFPDALSKRVIVNTTNISTAIYNIKTGTLYEA